MINELFSEIRTGKAVLLLGQEYFKADDNYYNAVLNKLKISNDTPSLNKLWKDNSNSFDLLSNALSSAAAEHSTYQPWLRVLFSLGWNLIVYSSINNLWIKNSIGNNFGLNIQTQAELNGNTDIYKIFNKKQLHLISLFGDENSIPKKTQLLKLKKQTNLLNMIYAQILLNYGYLVLEGISFDDWFDINRLLDNIDTLPYGHIYIFGANKKKLEDACIDEDSWTLFEECIDNGQIILCDKSLKDIIIESGMVEDIEEEQEFEHENEVRISLSEGDSIWISRKDCNQLSNIGITLMRDEILTPLIINDDNKERYFADFLQQRDKKSWGYFDIIYNKDKFSFHIPRDVEELMENSVSKQINSSNNKREIILLKGNSNSGKTTSLSWFAWHAAKQGFKKRKNSKHIVLYISGNPDKYDNEWQDILTDFIKDHVYGQQTYKKDRIRNIIIIWDNYSSTNKKADYISLYKKLNECNIILIGSIYLFESVDNKIVQDISFNELKPLKANLEHKAELALNNILETINPQWINTAKNSQSQTEYLFETLINFAKYKYSMEWEKVRNTLKARLSKEAINSESVSNKLFNIFKDRNANNFNEVRKTVFSLGIGAVTQSAFIKVSPEKQKRNVPLINSIRDMNLILAVASQFKKPITLPLSVLLRTISDGQQYNGDFIKLNKILRSDSMVEYNSNSSTGNVFISFRHSSEAVAYLDNNYGVDRKEKEIEVIIRLIKNCRWDIYEEAAAVTSFVRSFGTNSFGKITDHTSTRGYYREYSEYWNDIVDNLNSYASSNPEAMLVAGHLTRDCVEMYSTNNDNDIYSLTNALIGMENAVSNCSAKSTCSRLYGEMCRNLLQQIKSNGGIEKSNELSYSFKEYFELAVKNGKELKLNKPNFSMMPLLDIWLNYIFLYEQEELYKLLPDTLEYIELLFYNESALIDDNEDYVNIISNINKVYDIMSTKSPVEICNIFTNANNDSYVYCLTRQVLVKLYFKFKGSYSKIFDSNNERILSSRIFFLNENAANDFEYFKQTDASVMNIYAEIKQALIKASEEIINIFEREYKSTEEMTYRCLLLYLKAKWMYYTGNLLLEPEQYPVLSEDQWRELYNICKSAQANIGDNDILARSVNFVYNIYRFTFEGKRWEQHRYSVESPVRLICLCNFNENKKTIIPRLFNVSVKEKSHTTKLFADIDSEILNGIKIKTPILEQKNIYVPENIKNYRDIKRKNLNINRNFVIWFNLGGPQIQDYISDEEV